MPARTKNIIWPNWVEALEDPCLLASVKEALVAREFALDNGAKQHKACRAVLRAADTTLEQVEFGLVKGKDACRKAASAIRKFNTAGECSRPTARR